jgi:hypothetical protein
METKAESAIEAQPQNSRKLIDRYFKSRPDIGIGNLLLDVALEARDPFKSWEPRKWKKGFLAAVLVVLLAAAWFGYWNILN